MAIELININSQEVRDFYEKKFYFSYSSLNKLLFSPRVFYKHYVLDQREDSTAQHLIEGSLLHCLLLEPDKFNDNFILVPGSVPSGNNKQIVDEIFKLYESRNNDSLEFEDFEDDILEYLLSINLHQSLKTDEKRVEKVIIPDNQNYFSFLKKKGNKSVIDNNTLEKVKESVEYFKADSVCMSLLNLNSVNTKNELSLKCDLDNFNFGIKGIIDNLNFDYEEKTVFINDLKTTGKPIQKFVETVDYYRYDLQAAMYVKLINSLPEYQDWKIKFTFIVIDNFNQIYPFQVSDATMETWNMNLNKVFEVANYHYNNKEYGLPYDLANYNVIL